MVDTGVKLAFAESDDLVRFPGFDVLSLNQEIRVPPPGPPPGPPAPASRYAPWTRKSGFATVALAGSVHMGPAARVATRPAEIRAAVEQRATRVRFIRKRVDQALFVLSIGGVQVWRFNNRRYSQRRTASEFGG